MVYPPLIKSGDTIGITAPARKIKKEDLDFAINVLASWGLNVVVSKNILSAKHPYLSGSDHERTTDLQEMLDDKNIKAIIAARGGYGTTRILDGLDFDSIKRNPKWIVGFSDLTSMHLALAKHGIVSIHGFMPILFSKQDAASSLESLRQLLMSGSCAIEAPHAAMNRAGTAVGPVWGGNLSLILDAFGTATEPDLTDKILFLEEIDEPKYKLDRMMTQLRRSGKLKNISGLVIGHMTDIKDGELPFGESVEEIVLNAVHDYPYPVAFQLPSGHEQPNLSWYHGGMANLTVGADLTRLEFTAATSHT